VEAEEHNRNPVAWISLLIASVMMLITANLLINYGSTGSGGSLIDSVGEVLPYGLIAAVFVFYLLRLNIRAYRPSRPTLRRVQAPSSRVLRNLFIFLSSLLLAMTFFYFLFQGFKVLGGSLGTISTSNPSSPSGPNPPGITNPLLDLWSSLSILTLIITTATLLSAILLGSRKKRIQETIDEGDLESTGHIASSSNSFVDDDDRKAILAYYAQGRENMVERGVPLTEATTPREFEKGVLNTVSAASKDFSSLTRLFEEARFSIHNVGGSEREKAKVHYEKVKRTSSEVRRS
jgi:hypothetical protein